ncbi:MAG: DUF92 domain-containing protein, partial [Fidelibacterota bacterium]
MLPTYHPFLNEWVTFVVFLSVIALLIGLGEFSRGRLNWSPETNRKLVHVLVGVLLLSSPFLFESRYPPVTLAILFIIVNVAALKSGKLAGIHGTARKTYGTVYFPTAFLFLSFFWWDQPITLEISLLLLTFADTAAAAAGEHARTPERYVAWKDQKTVQGSVAMFLVSTVLIGFGTDFLYGLSGQGHLELHILVPLSLFVALLATVAEAVSSGGSDNLSVPMVTAIGYDLFLTSAHNGEVLILLSWILFSFAMALGAFRLNSLATDGALGAFVLGVFVFGIGKWKFMIPLGVFFVISSLLSQIRKDEKEVTRTAFGKGSKRDVVQVFANGGIPLLLAIWWFYTPSEWLYAIYLASVAAAAADTWGTEVGFFSESPPRNSVTFKRVEPGVSGGVTLVGTLGALAGSGVIALTGLPFVANAGILGWIIVAGFLASMVDSILGATVQGSYQCALCEKQTEMSVHCD